MSVKLILNGIESLPSIHQPEAGIGHVNPQWNWKTITSSLSSILNELILNGIERCLETARIWWHLALLILNGIERTWGRVDVLILWWCYSSMELKDSNPPFCSPEEFIRNDLVNDVCKSIQRCRRSTLHDLRVIVDMGEGVSLLN